MCEFASCVFVYVRVRVSVELLLIVCWGEKLCWVVGTPIVQLPEQLRTPEAVPSKLAICLPYIVLMLICLLR